MTGKGQKRNAVPVADAVSAVIDPVLQRRAGISVSLIQCWDEIAGERLAGSTSPQKIAWPRRAGEDDPFEPATLIVACESMAALELQHMTGEVIQRVNAFLGFPAIGRIRIVQKTVLDERPSSRPEPRVLNSAEENRLGDTLSGIDDEKLRAALERLGRNVIGSRS